MEGVKNNENIVAHGWNLARSFFSSVARFLIVTTEYINPKKLFAGEPSETNAVKLPVLEEAAGGGSNTVSKYW